MLSVSDRQMVLSAGEGGRREGGREREREGGREREEEGGKEREKEGGKEREGGRERRVLTWFAAGACPPLTA